MPAGLSGFAEKSLLAMLIQAALGRSWSVGRGCESRMLGQARRYAICQAGAVKPGMQYLRRKTKRQRSAQKAASRFYKNSGPPTKANAHKERA